MCREHKTWTGSRYIIHQYNTRPVQVEPGQGLNNRIPKSGTVTTIEQLYHM